MAESRSLLNAYLRCLHHKIEPPDSSISKEVVYAFLSGMMQIKEPLATINKNVSSVSLNKTFPFFLPVCGKVHIKDPWLYMEKYSSAIYFILNKTHLLS